jgi:hypothetical protein
MKKQNYYYILHILAGITIGYLLFSCRSNKSSCDAYSHLFTYRIEGKVLVNGDTCDAIAYTNEYLTTDDSVFYFNSNSRIQTILPPYTIYECTREQR